MAQCWPLRENPSGLDVIVGQFINSPTAEHESRMRIADIVKFLTAAIYNTHMNTICIHNIPMEKFSFLRLSQDLGSRTHY